MKFVRGCGYEFYNTGKVKEEHKEEAKADEETVTAEENKEAPALLLTHVNNNLNSILSNIEVYFNNQQIYNPNGLYMQKSYFSSNFKVAIFEYKGVLHCEGYENEEFPDRIMEAPLSEPKENENAQ